jgi:hypothetical protein
MLNATTAAQNVAGKGLEKAAMGLGLTSVKAGSRGTLGAQPEYPSQLFRSATTR